MSRQKPFSFLIGHLFVHSCSVDPPGSNPWVQPCSHACFIRCSSSWRARHRGHLRRMCAHQGMSRRRTPSLCRSTRVIVASAQLSVTRPATAAPKTAGGVRTFPVYVDLANGGTGEMGGEEGGGWGGASACLPRAPHPLLCQHVVPLVLRISARFPSSPNSPDLD